MLLIWWQLKPLIDTFIKPLMLIKKLVSFMTDFFKDSWNFCVVMRDELSEVKDVKNSTTENFAVNTVNNMESEASW